MVTSAVELEAGEAVEIEAETDAAGSIGRLQVGDQAVCPFLAVAAPGVSSAR